MILVEAGSYNGPSGLVTITRDYWIGETMVTQGLYEAVMGYNPSYHKGSDLFPVEQVSRRDFESFLLSLNTSLKSLFRLPYEVEWDYACMVENTAKVTSIREVTTLTKSPGQKKTVQSTEFSNLTRSPLNYLMN